MELLQHAESVLRSYQCETFKNQKTDVEVLVEEDARSLAFSFRGSTSWKDWKTNCSIVKDEGGDLPGLVHAGFFRAAKSVQRQVRGRISAWLASKSGEFAGEVVLRGHSQGGATSIVTAAMLAKHPVSLRNYRTEVRVFGCPHVANLEFRNWYNSVHGLGSETTCVVNEADPVTFIPKIGFAVNPGVEYQIWRKLSLNPATWVNAIGLRRLWLGRFPIPFVWKGDHSMVLYVQRLKEQLGNK